ncbi:MAG: hypothetical protein HOO67_01760 [Candidatus Peribacteraceae bacterium]|nr:hypothetical protein [Candidatus Peribacteraceae bacterium]
MDFNADILYESIRNANFDETDWPKICMDCREEHLIFKERKREMDIENNVPNRMAIDLIQRAERAFLIALEQLPPARSMEETMKKHASLDAPAWALDSLTHQAIEHSRDLTRHRIIDNIVCLRQVHIGMDRPNFKRSNSFLELIELINRLLKENGTDPEHMRQTGRRLRTSDLGEWVKSYTFEEAPHDL